MVEKTSVAVAARRAASWVALVSMFVVSGFGGPQEDGRDRLMAGGFAGALAAVSAIGESPGGFGAVGGAARWFAPTAWAAGRILFPLAGLAAGLAVRRGVDAFGAAAAVGIAMTAAIAIACRWAGGRAADSASAAIIASLWAIGIGRDLVQVAAVWLVTGAAAVAFVHRSSAMTASVLPRSSGQSVWLSPLPSQSSLRHWLVRGAMAACLVAMAALLLTPGFGPTRYAALAIGLFAALAVPQMTVGDGMLDREAWRTVLAGRPRRPVGRWPAKWAAALEARVAAGHAAMLVWPLVVVALLSRADQGKPPWGMAEAALAVVLAAALAVVISRSVALLRGGPEAAMAAIFAGFILAAAAVAGLPAVSGGWAMVPWPVESMLSGLG